MASYSINHDTDQSRSGLYPLMGLFVTTGASVIICIKLQDSEQSTLSDGTTVQWHHPFIQTMLMFFGEMLCGLVYIVQWKRNSNPLYEELIDPQDNQHRRKISPFFYLIPVTLDTLGSACVFTGLTIVAASIFQMTRAFLVVITATLSVFFLKKKLYAYNYLGIMLVVFGVLIVGLQAFVKQTGQTDVESSRQLFGLSLFMIAQVLQGTHLILQEYLLRIGLSMDGKTHIHPLEIVGMEGLWGFLVNMLIVLPLLQLIPCTGSYCNGGAIENSIQALEEVSNNPALVWLSLCFIATISTFNALGVTITHRASAAQRCIVDQTRVILVWVFFLLLPSSNSASESFSFLQMLGFAVLLLGALVYNQVVSLK